MYSINTVCMVTSIVIKVHTLYRSLNKPKPSCNNFDDKIRSHNFAHNFLPSGIWANCVSMQSGETA